MSTQPEPPADQLEFAAEVMKSIISRSELTIESLERRAGQLQEELGDLAHQVFERQRERDSAIAALTVLQGRS